MNPEISSASWFQKAKSSLPLLLIKFKGHNLVFWVPGQASVGCATFQELLIALHSSEPCSSPGPPLQRKQAIVCQRIELLSVAIKRRQLRVFWPLNDSQGLLRISFHELPQPLSITLQSAEHYSKTSKPGGQIKTTWALKWGTTAISFPLNPCSYTFNNSLICRF